MFYCTLNVLYIKRCKYSLSLGVLYTCLLNIYISSFILIKYRIFKIHYKAFIKYFQFSDKVRADNRRLLREIGLFARLLEVLRSRPAPPGALSGPLSVILRILLVPETPASVPNARALTPPVPVAADLLRSLSLNFCTFISTVSEYRDTNICIRRVRMHLYSRERVEAFLVINEL